jgi:hypothetical protein
VELEAGRGARSASLTEDEALLNLNPKPPNPKPYSLYALTLAVELEAGRRFCSASLTENEALLNFNLKPPNPVPYSLYALALAVELEAGRGAHSAALTEDEAVLVNGLGLLKPNTDRSIMPLPHSLTIPSARLFPCNCSGA